MHGLLIEKSYNWFIEYLIFCPFFLEFNKTSKNFIILWWHFLLSCQTDIDILICHAAKKKKGDVQTYFHTRKIQILKTQNLFY